MNVLATLDELAAETRWLRRLAGSLVRDGATADDLVHDTVVVAAERAPGDGRPLRPWLARVLVNLVRMHSRGGVRRGRREQAVADLAVAPATPEAIVGQLELQRMLAGLVLELATPLRDVLLLHYFEGLSSAAIAGRLGLSDGTVRWRLKQAIDELRDRLEHREPNRAWVAPLAAFAGIQPGARPAAASGAALALAAGAAVLVVALAVLAWWTHGPAPRPGFAARTPAQAARALSGAPRVPGAPARPAMTARLAPGAAEHPQIIGVVVDRDGHPVEDADVALDCMGRPRLQRSGRDGRFVFQDAEDLCYVQAVKGDLVSGAPHFMPGEPVVLTLEAVPVAVFEVLDASTAAPIAGAQLRDFGFGVPNTAVTDAAGRARLRVLGDESEVSIRASGYLPRLDQFTNAPATGGPPRTVRLTRGISVSGHVLWGGVPTANTTLAIEGQGSKDTSPTDASGAFTVTVPRAGRYELHVLADEVIEPANLPALEVSADGRSGVVVPVEPRGRVTGMVVDSAGTPVAGARVRVGRGTELQRLRHILPTLTSDAQGRFSFGLDLRVTGFMPMGGEPLTVVAFRGSEASEPVAVEPADAREHLTATLQLGPAGVAGIVVDPAGTPVGGVDVVLDTLGGEYQRRFAKADAHGRFAFEVARGQFTVFARRSADDEVDDRNLRPVTGGARDVRLVLR